jgi:hypothetical protein
VVGRPMCHREPEALERSEHLLPKRAGDELKSKPCLRGLGRAAMVTEHEWNTMLPNV